ncbi:LPXTG cell wall anchor domain-containing protein [Streptomyces klenkii]|uniref:LPXTG cell wall anchor domain-containing protein n=1 Tax=Streptomyces klenkii TaxID=1420899 RepID=UPI0033A0EF17
MGHRMPVTTTWLECHQKCDEEAKQIVLYIENVISKANALTDTDKNNGGKDADIDKGTGKDGSKDHNTGTTHGGNNTSTGTGTGTGTGDDGQTARNRSGHDGHEDRNRSGERTSITAGNHTSQNSNNGHAGVTGQPGAKPGTPAYPGTLTNPTTAHGELAHTGDDTNLPLILGTSAAITALGAAGITITRRRNNNA